MTPDISENSKYLLEIIRAALKGEQTPPPPEGADFAMLYAAAKAHLLAPMAYHGLYRLGLPEEQLAPFAEAHRKNVKRSLMQEAQAKRVFAALESLEIDYCPVKGWFTRLLYPDPSMRVMSDVDILIRPENRPDSKKLMDELGYTCIRYDKADDDKYKLSGLLTEFHTGLDSAGTKDRAHYEKPFALTEKVSEHGYRLMAEEEYLYTVIHALKHFMNYGLGIRALIDVYLYLTKAGLDRNKVASLAEEMGVSRFLACMEKTAMAAFGGKDLDEESAEILKFMLECGAGGTAENYEAVRLMRTGGGTKASYLVRKIFPPTEEMKQRDPILKKHIWLLPFMHVRRWFQLIFTGRDRIEQGLGRIAAVSEEDKERIRRIHSITGIEL